MFNHENMSKSSFGIFNFFKLLKIIKFNNMNATSHSLKKLYVYFLTFINQCQSIINI